MQKGVMLSLPTIRDLRIAVVGLGYVGLPLAVDLGRTLEVIGLDVDSERISELLRGHDRTRECSSSELKAAKKLTFTSNIEDVSGANFFIVTVPTPVDAAKRPDLTPLVKASETVG